MWPESPVMTCPKDPRQVPLRSAPLAEAEPPGRARAEPTSVPGPAQPGANKTALITGGNSGIGLATARLFLAEGARVAIVGRNKKTLDAAAEMLGADVLAIQADVTDVESTERAVATTAERFGKLDVVFANAGVTELSPLGRTSLEAFEQIIRTNLTAVFFTVQAALPHLHDRASIILNGSVLAVMGMPGWSAYAAAKGGVRTMTRHLASELAPRGIRVNQVTPGGTRTPIWSRLAPTDDAMAALGHGSPAAFHSPAWAKPTRSRRRCSIS